MRCVFDWLAEKIEIGDSYWTIVGKGPSFSRLAEDDIRRRVLGGRSIGLNHAAIRWPCTLAHAIDLEAATEVASACLEAERPLVVPWQPHVKCQVGRLTIEEILLSHMVGGARHLLDLDDAGLLLWYNHSYAKRRNANSSITVRVRWFSAEAAMHMLLLAGIRKIQTIGVDGGTDYADAFDKKDLLSNGHPSFDRQFPEMSELAKEYGAEVVKI